MTSRRPIFCLALLILIGCAQNPKPTLNTKPIVGDKFTVISRTQDGNELTLEIKNKTNPKIIIKKITKASFLNAEQHFNTTKNYLLSLYAPVNEPYFGSFASVSNCPSGESVMSTYFNEAKTYKWAVFQMPATQKFLIGSCDYSTSYYKSELTIVYCKQDGIIYKIQNFFSIENLFDASPASICGKYFEY